MTPVVLLVAGVSLLALSLYWMLVETEGVYLGRRVVIWLYDLYARRYDQIKSFHPDYEQWLLAEPILGILAPQQNPLVLDVATGTGRLPLALLDNPHFQGRVVGVDLSRAMLRQAANKLRGHERRVDLLWSSAEVLPFPDATFDMVTCLEALEFVPDAQIVIAEMARVLRPGGLLLITNRINMRWMPGKTFSDEHMQDLLERHGFEDVMPEIWQIDYHKIWATRAGESAPVGTRPLAEFLRCPNCQQVEMEAMKRAWRCNHCGAKIPVGGDGVIELQTAVPPR
ncbi:MAG: methyltransferase domain-containing protein [bacterium]|nr:methyltransferase domain-containing protein [bacterium]